MTTRLVVGDDGVLTTGFPVNVGEHPDRLDAIANYRAGAIFVLDPASHSYKQEAARAQVCPDRPTPRPVRLSSPAVLIV